MALPVYPEGLPCPLRDNYAFSPTNNIRRTDMDSGRARQRLEFRNVPTMVDLKWIMTSDQAAVFETWAANIAGAGWFEMEILTPLGFETQEMRFTETPDGGELQGKFLWQYTVTCEVRNRPLLDPDWVILLPDFLVNPEIFDYAMNREWPLNPWQTYADAMDTAINEDWPTP